MKPATVTALRELRAALDHLIASESADPDTPPSAEQRIRDLYEAWVASERPPDGWASVLPGTALDALHRAVPEDARFRILGFPVTYEYSTGPGHVDIRFVLNRSPLTDPDARVSLRNLYLTWASSHPHCPLGGWAHADPGTALREAWDAVPTPWRNHIHEIQSPDWFWIAGTRVRCGINFYPTLLIRFTQGEQ